MSSHRFLKPLDVLFLRGNSLFGSAGQHGQALMPPWPSVAAGALRSRMLADAGVDFAALKANQPPSGALGSVLGTPDAPGSFQLAGLWLARQTMNACERFHPAPADVVNLNGTLCRLRPQTLPLPSSYPLPQTPVLQSENAGKAQGGWLLNSAGWLAWLKDEPLNAAQHITNASELYGVDDRLGIALNGESRTAADGALYTAQAIAMKRDVGFAVAVRGADGHVPETGMLRLGGDGRAATISAMPAPVSGGDAIAPGGRFKLILTTPGIFDGGWKLPGLDANHVWHGPDGCTAKLVCAAVSRAETVSGWDLAKWQPKTAQRVAPTGSVYWFEDFQGNPAALGNISETGLWGLPGQNDDPQRRAEGFNLCAVGSWL